MKKLALILALMIIPCSAFGLEMLNDSSMDDITGQAGVAIAMDDVQMFINIEKLAWIDCDGFDSLEGKGSCSGAGGAIALNNFQIDVLNINAITRSVSDVTGSNLRLASTACGDIPLFYQYGTDTVANGCFLPVNGRTQNLGLNNYYGKYGSNNAFTPHFLTIDVTDKLPAMSEGLQEWRANAWTSAAVDFKTGAGVYADDANSSMGGVLIGIPTMEIYINSMTLTPVYDGDIGAALTSNAVNDDNVTWNMGTGVQSATFGTVQMTGITFTTLSGWIEIAPK